jgi:uncharacterized SAM-dependent methyltransferase
MAVYRDPAGAGWVKGEGVNTVAKAQVELDGYLPSVERMRREVIAGLRQRHKSLPCKYFYDEEGSRLFDLICELPEYYLTRTELSIMRQSVGEMAEAVGERAMLIEYGSGSSMKTRLLLEALREPVAYVPIDISREHLMRSAEGLAEAYPAVEVLPVCADYMGELEVPEPIRPPGRRVVYFPGSTIGNFQPIEAREFLRGVRRVCGESGGNPHRSEADRAEEHPCPSAGLEKEHGYHTGGLLIGVDLKKDPGVLHAAYNDSEGVTAAFNRNVLVRLNGELGADFDPERFDHYAYYHPRLGRMEMHLVSRGRQVVRVGEAVFTFEDGESVHTESSYKYTIEGFTRLAGEAGWVRRRAWVDERGWFGVFYLTAARA